MIQMVHTCRTVPCCHTIIEPYDSRSTHYSGYEMEVQLAVVYDTSQI